MQSSPQPVAIQEAIAATPQRPLSDLVYPGMTLIAMLLLLASLWVF